MANETFIKGNQVVFSIWDTDAYEPMACITSSSISESLEIDEIETKCDPGNIVKTPGSYSYEITSDGIYIDESVDTGLQSHGEAGSNATFSITISGTGAIVSVDPNA